MLKFSSAMFNLTITIFIILESVCLCHSQLNMADNIANQKLQYDYFCSDMDLTWNEASDYCKQKNGSLISLIDTSDIEYVSNVCLNTFKKSRTITFSIGLTCSQNKWRWMRNNTILKDWNNSPGVNLPCPDNRSLCAAATSPTRWFTHHCDSRHRFKFVCEIPCKQPPVDEEKDVDVEPTEDRSSFNTTVTSKTGLIADAAKDVAGNVPNISEVPPDLTASSDISTRSHVFTQVALNQSTNTVVWIFSILVFILIILGAIIAIFLINMAINSSRIKMKKKNEAQLPNAYEEIHDEQLDSSFGLGRPLVSEYITV